MDTSHPNFKRIVEYIKQERIGVISTVDSERVPHGASMWLIVIKDKPYFITGKHSRTYINLSKHNELFVTITDTVETSSLQIRGEAFEETSKTIRNEFLRQLRDILHTDEDLSRLAEADYVIMGVKVKSCFFTEYPGQRIFERTVTELY